ncbi:MAG: TIM barrel protein [Verrucomicrobiae bacterium]|nr:TIM barrel protein [Verrucomicrobiae bacterium]
MDRRQFLLRSASAALVAASPAVGQAAEAAAPRLLDRNGDPIPLGMDNFAVRALGLKGRDLVDYAAALRLDTLFITDLPALGTLDPGAVAALRKYAADQGLALLLGSWSICPTSKTFKNDWGTAEEHLALGIRLSQAAGSPAFRVVLGSREDRRTPGGIEARIADTVRVLKSQRSVALDHGVKLAIENHAGDMTATELAGLVEAAGPDYVGVNLDSGNALWTLEDPLESLEILGRYTLTTSLRDSAVWQTDKGCKVQWTAFGEGGCIDQKRFFERFAQLCPGVAVNVETIGGFAAEFPYLDPEFWTAFPKKPASEFARFLAIARRGQPVPPDGLSDRERQEGELRRSLEYLRDVIGLGTRS